MEMEFAAEGLAVLVGGWYLSGGEMRYSVGARKAQPDWDVSYEGVSRYGIMSVQFAV